MQALNHNEPAYEKFAIRVRDDEGGVSATRYITVTITGKNDAPTAIHSFASGNNSVVEAGHDDAAMLTAPSTDNNGDDNAAGSFAINDVDAENNAANLGVMIRSKSRIDGAGITDADGGGADVRSVVARHARNAEDTGNAANQNPGGDVSGPQGDGTTATFFKGEFGTLTYTLATHSWTYALGNSWDSVNRLDANEAEQDIFTFTFTDARGAQVTRDVIITVTGTNDQPVIDVDSTRTCRQRHCQRTGTDQ